MMITYVTPTTQRRTAKWLRIFGTDELPVLQSHPRRQEARDGVRLVYDLAVGRLHRQQLARLAAYVSSQGRRPYNEVLFEVTALGRPLDAEGLEIVNDVDTAVSEDVEKRPFFGLWPRRVAAGMAGV